MKVKDIFLGTLPFIWAKVLLGLTLLVFGLVWALILGVFTYLFDAYSLIAVVFSLWLGGIGVAHFFLMRYAGYLVKVGHIAVIVEAVTKGTVPENQVQYGKERVIKRFGTSNIYFLIDGLISGAVKQLQHLVNKTTDFLSFIPGANIISGALNLFISISLGYIDECCLGYTFYKEDQSAYKSAADGVVIYAQNWKSILLNAAKTALIVILGTGICFMITFSIFGAVFKVLGWSSIIAFILSLFTAWTIKTAFIDTYILISTMNAYMKVAPSTEITFDLYNKLCGMSSKFKNLFNKGQEPVQQELQV